MYLTPSSTSGNLTFGITTNGKSSEQIIQTSGLISGQWVYVAVTYDGTTASLHLNGDLAASGKMTVSPATFNPALNYLGQSQSKADPFFAGEIDTLIVANYAMSAAQIASPFGSVALPALIHRYSFNETSGTIAQDSVGGADGSLRGSATFDGSGNVVLSGTSGTYVSLPGNLLAGLTNVTIEAWVTNAPSPDNVALFSFDDGLQDGVGGGYLRYVLHDQNNGRNFMELASGGGSPLIPGYPGLGGKYVHVVCIYNMASGIAAIYTNGVLEASKAVSTALTNVSTNAAALGRSPWNGDPWLNGAIDEFRIYAGRLLPDDIAAAQIAGPNTLLTTNVLLGVSQDNGIPTLYWPVAASGFLLEASPILGPDAVWTPLNASSTVSDLNNEVTITATNATMFFRLRR